MSAPLYNEMFTDTDEEYEQLFKVVPTVDTKRAHTYTYDKLVEFIESKAQGYEIVDGYCIPSYDYEKMYENQQEQEANMEADLEKARTAIREAYAACPDMQLYCFSACGCDLKKRWKNSFHFRVRGCGYLAQGASCKQIAGFDASVYKAKGKRQLVRMPLCSKEGEDRPLLPLGGDSICREWFIQYTDTESALCSVRQLAKPVVAPRAATTGRKYTAAEIESLLDCIDYEEQVYEWEQWTKIVWGLRNMADEYEIDLRALAHTVSRVSSKYDSA